MTAIVDPGLQTPGEISIDSLLLVSYSGKFIPVLDYLVEFNLYESIYNDVLSGELMLSDSANLIKEFPIIGEELLVVKMKTPTFPDELAISKTFRIVAVEDRKLIKDQNTQLYKLKFVSTEAILDSGKPLFAPYEGKVTDIVAAIYESHIKTTRTYTYNSESSSLSALPKKTDLIFLNNTANSVKFVSPGWTPFQCINWLSKKSIPKDGLACDFLFWETNKSFYFGSIEKIFSSNQQNPTSIGKYWYAPPSVIGGADSVAEKMFLIENLEIVSTIDHLASIDSGYFSSRVLDINYLRKTYDNVDYDHTTEFNQYKHLNAGKVKPLFSENTAVRNPETHIRINPKQPGLHGGALNNANEIMGTVYSNRLSNLTDINNLKLNITIHGRTDIEAGRIIEIVFPDVAPARESDITTEHKDSRYSGYYLITSINHKVNVARHSMTMEVVRESLSDLSTNTRAG